MRISDWSSDVCSSDLESVRDAFALSRLGGVVTLTSYVTRATTVEFPLFDLALRGRDVRSSQSGRLDMTRDMAPFLPWMADGRVEDRKSVVLGKSVSVRVDHGGRRIIKKTKQIT